MIALGDRLPLMTFKNINAQGEMRDITLDSLCQAKKIVMFAVPGAFTPLCSKTHVPSFLAHVKDFQEKGVACVICLSVNDPFVMKAWAESLPANDSVLFLADGNGDFTEKMGMVLDGRAHGLGLRSQRYVLMAEDGVVTSLAVEENPGACTVSHAESFLKRV